MTNTDLIKFTKKIEEVSAHFEDKPWTQNVKFLKADFDSTSLKSPKEYSLLINELDELLRETRLLFLHTIFEKICLEENKLYYFDTPYQAGMSYLAVVKKEGSFYLYDEDGDFSEIFTSEKFTQFIDDNYWELYD